MVSTQDKITALTDALLFTGDAWVENHALLVRDGEVIDIAPNHRISPESTRLSYPGKMLVPGFIDGQVNGGGNILFNNKPTVEACLEIASAHLRFGTTRLLITCISDSADVTRLALFAMREARKVNKAILGIHIEGPHLGHERRGVHRDEFLRPLSASDMGLYKPQGDEVILLTVAPECVSDAQIKQLHEQGNIVFLGHTNASAEQTRSALKAGATGFTHLYNGMTGLSARAPGVIGVALDDASSWCGLIADGFHVSPEMIRLAIHAKPRGKVFLVSDAMSPAASEKPRPFLLYNEAVSVTNGCCLDNKGALAGSAITMLEAVSHLVTKVGIDLEESLRMASRYPADALGLGEKHGRLLPGYTADVVALDHDLKSVRPVLLHT